MIASLAQYLFFIGLILIFFGETIAANVNIPKIREICDIIAQFSHTIYNIYLFIHFMRNCVLLLYIEIKCKHS